MPSFKRSILAPLGATLVALVVIFIVSAYWRQHQTYFRDLESARQDFERSYQSAVEAEVATMTVALELLTRDEA